MPSAYLKLSPIRAADPAVVAGAYDQMDGGDLTNTRHVIDPANNLYAPAISWGSEQLEITDFER